MSEGIELSKIGVVMLGTSDTDASVQFYQDRLGMKLTGRHGEFAFFDGGGVSLVLSPDLSPVASDGPKSSEVVFSVDTARPGLNRQTPRFKAAGLD